VITSPPALAEDLRCAVRLWLAWTSALFVLAAILHLAGLGTAVRDGIGDPGLTTQPAGPSVALQILARNVSVAALFLTAAASVSRHPNWRPAGDLFVITTAVLTLITGATSLAAFGGELVRYAIVFGPIEIAGFTVAAATYATARRRPPVSLAALALRATLCAASLALAAVLEARFGGTL